MAKVILLNSSPRANSNTQDVLEVCAEEIEKNGVEAEIISLRGKQIQSCVACNGCAKTGNCVLNDGLDEMAALQRIGKVSRGNDKFLEWMVGGPIAVARRGGQTLTLQEMTMFFPINNMIIAGSTYWNMVFAGPEGTALDDSEGIATIKLFGQNVANIIIKLVD